MAIYINCWEHYSSLFSSCSDFADEINGRVKNCLLDDFYPLDEPSDLYDFIESRGTRSKDNFTIAAMYVSKKLIRKNVEADRLGIIFATEYGNINSMYSLGNLGKSSTDPISAKLFPNATISSATVSVAIDLMAQGLNVTVNSGILSFYQAIMIACNYINDGKLDYCIVLSGDDYNKFATEDVLMSDIKVNKFLSNVSGILISNNRLEDGKNYIIKNVKLNKMNDTLAESNNFIDLMGYRYINEGSFSNIKTPDVYIGPSVGFIELLNCFQYLDNNSGVDQCCAAVVDNNSYISIAVGRDEI